MGRAPGHRPPCGLRRPDPGQVERQLTPGSEGQGKLLIRANAAELGAGSSTHEAAVTGEHNQVALNVKFLADGIAACETAQIAIELVDERQPMLLRSVGSDSYCYVAMPMSIH